MQGQPYDWFNLEDMGALIQSEEFASTLKEAFCVVVFIPKLINLQRQTHPCCFFWVDASLQVEKILLQSLKIHLKSISQIHGVQFFNRFPKGKSNAVPKGPCFSAALDANLIGCRT
jgi:hypothetical protein